MIYLEAILLPTPKGRQSLFKVEARMVVVEGITHASDWTSCPTLCGQVTGPLVAVAIYHIASAPVTCMSGNTVNCKLISVGDCPKF